MALVKYFATLREITGKREETVRGVKNIKELMQLLINRYGDKFAKELRDRAMILVNGKNILHIRDMDTEIEEEDVVSIFPPAGGG